MATPRTHAELVEAGYVFTGQGNCKACRARILFYRTPNWKHMPMNPADFTSHFANCPEASTFRKPAPKKPKPPATGQGGLF